MSIDIKLIDPYVVSALQKIGWHENRKIDISYWKAVLKNEGYIIFDYAEELLENFGGIEVNSIIATIYSCAQFDFDPLNAASGEFDRINYYQSTTHDQLYPIGSLVEGIAYVGLSKKIYWGSVDKIYLELIPKLSKKWYNNKKTEKEDRPWKRNEMENRGQYPMSFGKE